MTVLCPNCESDKHARCCSWCGRVHAPKRRSYEHCSAKCANAAADADKLSAEAESARVDREFQIVLDAEKRARANTAFKKILKLGCQPLFRRVKVMFYTHGGKGRIAWRQPHERYAWVPLEEAGSERVTITFADLGEQQCTIIGRDTLVIPGDLRAQCEDVE